MRHKFSNATIPLIIINVFIFILQTVLGSGFTQAFLFASQDAFIRPWIFITSMFLHGGPYHLLFNMYALLLIGSLIENRIGTKRFLFIYFTAGILGSLVSIPFYNASLGASGGVMGLLGVTIMLMPDLPVLFFFFIPMKLRTAAVFFVLIDFFGVFFPFGIASIDHLVGLACGLAFGFYLLKMKGRLAQKMHKKAHRSPSESYLKRRDHSNLELSKDDMDDYLKYGKI